MRKPFVPSRIRETLKPGWDYISLPRLENYLGMSLKRLPCCLRIVLESLARHCDSIRISEEDIVSLAQWSPQATREREIPFVVARVLLQDFTGVPLLVDLAAMREQVRREGKSSGLIEPLVPVELVVDHSIQVDYARVPDALAKNMELEFLRNHARYEFLKWGAQAFRGFSVVPPGVGIVHQVNLEFLARGVMAQSGLLYPDSLVGTDSHTTMINGLGIVGWGVGGIEAESAMLGQPVYFLTPDVIGVHLVGKLPPGATATDLVLYVTEALRKKSVVGKFVEFFGAGAASLSVPDRATLANMAPEYGATMGFFPVDKACSEYLKMTGRSKEQVELFENYYQAQNLFKIPVEGEIDYSDVVAIDLSQIHSSIAGPKRPQDRIALYQAKTAFRDLLGKPVKEGGFEASRIEVESATDFLNPSGGNDLSASSIPNEKDRFTTPRDTNPLTEIEMMQNRPTAVGIKVIAHSAPQSTQAVRHGSVVIAAITSCTNTSNPSVMLAAGLVARKARAKGMTVPGWVKTSLAPGSRAVTEYLKRTKLQNDLDALGFQTVGYGCTTCIGNSGPLAAEIESKITADKLVVASVLSGNRNFEARIHQSVKANFLMSPPLVVAFALAGRIDIDMEKDPIGFDENGTPVFLKDLWPSMHDLEQAMAEAQSPEDYRALYAKVGSVNPLWNKIKAPEGEFFQWTEDSTYIRQPPYFEHFTLKPQVLPPIEQARALAVFGDSITTDHISPAGAIAQNSPAGKYLSQCGVPFSEFNTYGARRGNHEVMLRGTFANIRIKNLMVPGVEGGVTKHLPSGQVLSIFEASQIYQKERIPLLIFAGHEYGTGSSRDWAAKGTMLLGVRAVIAESFERIHRSNLVGMGVLPCQFEQGTNAGTLGIDGTETFTLQNLTEATKAPAGKIILEIRKQNKSTTVSLTVRLDTLIEVEYYRHGGILPYTLRQLLKS